MSVLFHAQQPQSISSIVFLTNLIFLVIIPPHDCFVIINVCKMYSFSNQSSIDISQNDHTHPSLSQMSFLSIPFVHNEQMLEGYSQMQTPNFHEPFEHYENQHILDTNPDKICTKNSLVNKLIQTFEDLGLDVEYLDDSQTQDEQHSADRISQDNGSHIRIQVKKQESNQNQSTDAKAEQNNKSNFLLSYKQKMQLLKEFCMHLRGQLSSISSEQEKFRAQCKQMVGNVVQTFQAVLCDSRHFQRLHIGKGQQQSSSQAELQLLRKAQNQLSNIIEQKQQNINSLIIQNEHLSLENSMLHFQLDKLVKKYEKFKEYKEQYEFILKNQHHYQKRVNQLQEDSHQLNKKIEFLQWNLKQAHKNLCQTSEQSHIYKQQLEQRYRKAFQETAQKLRKKIEAQTYYKMKYEYHFNIERIESRLKYYRSIDKQHFRYIKGGIVGHYKQNYDSPSSNSDSSAQEITSNATNSQLNTSLFLRVDSNCYESSKLLSNNLQEKERQLDKLLKDIKMTKESTAQNSLVSSVKGDFRRQSFSRSKGPRV